MPSRPTPSPRQGPQKNAGPATLDLGVLGEMIGYNCLQVYLNLLPNIRKQLAKYQLRPVEFTVLTLVRRNPEINQKRLGDAINVSPPNMATLLDRMEAEGLLERRRNPRDKRSQILALTPHGLEICLKAEKASAKVDTVSHLTAQERSQLLALLQKIFLGAPATMTVQALDDEP